MTDDDAKRDAKRLLEKELDRQAEQLVEYRRAGKAEVAELEKEIKDVSALRKEVQILSETVKSNTQVMYILVGLLISSGIIGALLKGGVF
jgi:hypothetical protein